MKTKRIMLIAGEASGDLLAADLVRALAQAVPEIQNHLTGESQPLTTPLPPDFFGAGGRKMAEAGVKLAVDMTLHSVTGFSDVIKNYRKFRQIFDKLVALAIERKPDLIILVDFGAFNLRFATAIRKNLQQHEHTFSNWSPKIVQFVSPQVWASRPGRAKVLERDADLLLSLFPFEKDWYAKHAPKLRVEVVGHPILDRFADGVFSATTEQKHADGPVVLLLPGSRSGELQRHLPVMVEAAQRILGTRNVNFRTIFPNEKLVGEAKIIAPELERLSEIHVGQLAQALVQSTLAIASTGTVLLECAYFRVPTVAMYKTSWSTYQIGKRIAKVKWLSMPNILAGEEVYPEFIQDAATPENVTQAALKLINDTAHRQEMKAKLTKVISSLGGPGATHRATAAILDLMGWSWNASLRSSLQTA